MQENRIFTPPNPLQLFDEEGRVDVDKMAEIMEISRAELAEVFGLSASQLRPDRISRNTEEKIGKLASALNHVAESLNGDIKKTRAWIKIPNMNFGGSSPRELILRGKYRKVLMFILSAQER